MPKNVVLTCLSPHVKEVAQLELAKIQNPQVKAIFIEILKTLVDCKDGQVIGIELQETAQKTARQKRAPSAYNLHVGRCMKAGNGMKECAVLWKTSPDNPKKV